VWYDHTQLRYSNFSFYNSIVRIISIWSTQRLHENPYQSVLQTTQLCVVKPVPAAHWAFTTLSSTPWGRCRSASCSFWLELVLPGGLLRSHSHSAIRFRTASVHQPLEWRGLQGKTNSLASAACTCSGLQGTCTYLLRGGAQGSGGLTALVTLLQRPRGGSHTGHLATDSKVLRYHPITPTLDRTLPGLAQKWKS
jgi:hypothetical protein